MGRRGGGGGGGEGEEGGTVRRPTPGPHSWETARLLTGAITPASSASPGTGFPRPSSVFTDIIKLLERFTTTTLYSTVFVQYWYNSGKMCQLVSICLIDGYNLLIKETKLVFSVIIISPTAGSDCVTEVHRVEILNIRTQSRLQQDSKQYQGLPLDQ